MSPTQGIAALKRLLGKNARYRYDEKAPSASERAQAEAKLPALIAARNAAKEKLDARYKELVSDPLYRELSAEHKRLSNACSDTSHRARHHFRVTLGTVNSVAGLSFFHVDAQGDNWADVIAKLKAKKAAV